MSSVDAQEITKFAKDSSHWWDEHGPFAPLHRINPVRLAIIKDWICAQYERDRLSFRPFTGLRILDIGCGGGLVCEPMARLGADVTGIDADSNAIEVAARHADSSGLKIDYRAAASEDLRKAGERYDIVLALEIIEHVADPRQFVEDCLSLAAPGGMVIFSTLNRTPQSLLLGKFAAEYILGWVPKGTHDWKKFMKPSELARAIRDCGATPGATEGIVYDPLTRTFDRSRENLAINYLISAIKED